MTTLYVFKCIAHGGILHTKRLTHCPVCKAFVTRGNLSDVARPIAAAVTRQRVLEKKAENARRERRKE